MGSDFLQAFVHFLRSSSFTFLDAREHVSLRGYLSVDVDGRNAGNFVISENVSRRIDKDNDSFSKKVAKTQVHSPSNYTPQNYDYSGSTSFSFRDAQLAKIATTRHNSFSPTRSFRSWDAPPPNSTLPRPKSFSPTRSFGSRNPPQLANTFISRRKSYSPILHKNLQLTHNNDGGREKERNPSTYAFLTDRKYNCNSTFNVNPGSRDKPTQSAPSTDTDTTSISLSTIDFTSRKGWLRINDKGESKETTRASLSTILKPKGNDQKVSFTRGDACNLTFPMGPASRGRWLSRNDMSGGIIRASSSYVLKPTRYDPALSLKRRDGCNLTFPLGPGSRFLRGRPAQSESKTDTNMSVSPSTAVDISSIKTWCRSYTSESKGIIDSSSYVVKPIRNDQRVSNKDSQQDKTFRNIKRPQESIKLPKSVFPKKPTNPDIIDCESPFSMTSSCDNNASISIDKIQPTKSSEDYLKKSKHDEKVLLGPNLDDDDEEEETSTNTSELPYYLVEGAIGMETLPPDIVVSGNSNITEREMVESKQENKLGLKDDDNIPKKYNDLSGAIRTTPAHPAMRDKTGGINNPEVAPGSSDGIDTLPSDIVVTGNSNITERKTVEPKQQNLSGFKDDDGNDIPQTYNDLSCQSTAMENDATGSQSSKDTLLPVIVVHSHPNITEKCCQLELTK